MSDKNLPQSTKIEIIKACLKSERGKQVLDDALKLKNGLVRGDEMDPYEILQMFDMKVKVAEEPFEETDRFELMDFE